MPTGYSERCDFPGTRVTVSAPGDDTRRREPRSRERVLDAAPEGGQSRQGRPRAPRPGGRVSIAIAKVSDSRDSVALLRPSCGPSPSDLNDLVQYSPELGVRVGFLPELAVGSSELEPQVRHRFFRGRPLTPEGGDIRSHGLPVGEAKRRHEDTQGLHEGQL